MVTIPEAFAIVIEHHQAGRLQAAIAADFDDYVERAVFVAGDLPRLTELRGALRPRMAASPLCDGKRFATNLASLLRKLWEASPVTWTPTATPQSPGAASR